jgi:hypothetical protein
MIGRVCYLQLLLALASGVIKESDSRWANSQNFLSQIRDFPKLEGQVQYLYFPETG